jgi:hypothetical protein
MPGGAPGTRSCTADFKIKITGRWLKAHGATPDNPARVDIGISLDEIHRVNNRRAMPYEQPVYPLLEHDPPLRRAACQRIIAAAGLPVPGKSVCWFCPLRRLGYCKALRRDQPELFARACQLEDLLNQRRTALGKHPVWLTGLNRPLHTIRAAQDMLPGFNSNDSLTDGLCDNGACFT